ncbi:HNH endonuclease signature motif containing protein [Tumebacillus sp. DT12]|uniref:HNH endonuclease signature motif containing protein n=1 Tax=Tumebacillus lacus TaxID=2995335 RepID=A0ABT3X0A6_9BACL|nr:HNH endonuclease signature motif containing protein [Tumebacillus lacus]MCX7569197.1 HNH endonuclease signature motif containing protein [Tumebacillus lacus]
MLPFSIEEIMSAFPKAPDGGFLSSFEEEFKDFMLKRLIATYIPNRLPTTDVVRLSKYIKCLVGEVQGSELANNQQFISYLVVQSINYHNRDRKIDRIEHNNFCNSCSVSFSTGHIGLERNNIMDVLNPGTYFSNIDKNNDIQIDHISPISKLGTGSAGNLQVLCFVCNSGKSDLFASVDKMNTFSERVEIERYNEFVESERNYVTGSTKADKNFFPFRLFYRVLNRDRSCVLCKGENVSSLTIMPVQKKTLYTYDNLLTVCYSCLEENDPVREVRFVRSTSTE